MNELYCNDCGNYEKYKPHEHKKTKLFRYTIKDEADWICLQCESCNVDDSED